VHIRQCHRRATITLGIGTNVPPIINDLPRVGNHHDSLYDVFLGVTLLGTTKANLVQFNDRLPPEQKKDKKEARSLANNHPHILWECKVELNYKSLFTQLSLRMIGVACINIMHKCMTMIAVDRMLMTWVHIHSYDWWQPSMMPSII
jgi:hypothetical protein